MEMLLVGRLPCACSWLHGTMHVAGISIFVEIDAFRCNLDIDNVIVNDIDLDMRIHVRYTASATCYRVNRSQIIINTHTRRVVQTTVRAVERKPRPERSFGHVVLMQYAIWYCTLILVSSVCVCFSV